jgi:hypothetical protein
MKANLRAGNAGRIEMAFTRQDLCGVLAVALILGLIVWPALAGNPSRSHRVICANNLRQVGQGFLLWAQEHSDYVPFDVEPAFGGTRLHPLGMNAWFQFSWISNELISPKVLFCPSEASGQPAADFSGSPSTGYVHPNFANRATSYFLAHAGSTGPGAVLAGDRNIPASGQTTCSRFRTTYYASTAWLSDLHGQQGNLLHADGGVTQASNARFDALINQERVNGSTFHLVLPR